MISPAQRAVVAKLAPVVAGAAALGFVALAVRLGVIAYDRSPIWDQVSYVFVGELAAGIFDVHNEHRIILSKAIFILDAIIHADGALNLVFVYVFLCLHGAILYRLVVRAFEIHEPVLRAALIIFGGSILFSGAQWENFSSGFQNQFTAVYALATCAFFILAHYAASGRRAFLALAVVAGILSAWSMANGLVALALLAALGLAMRLKRRDIALLAGVAGVVWALYLIGYSRGATSHGDPLSRLANLGALAHFTLVYLGGALAQPLSAVLGANEATARAALAAAAGGAGVLAAAVFALRTALNPDRTPYQLAAVGVLLFIGATAFVTAMGRVELGLEAALASRYATAAAPFWAVLGGLALGAWRGGGRRSGAAAALLVCAALIAWTFPHWTRETLEFTRVRKVEPNAAILAGVYAPDILGAAYPDPAYLWSRHEAFRAASRAVHAHAWAKLSGRTLQGFDGLGGCEGALLESETWPEAGAWRLRFAGPFAPGAAAIAIVRDEDRTVLSFALANTRADPVRPWPLPTLGERVWEGYVAVSEPTTVTAAALDRRGRPLCRLQGAQPLNQSKGLIADPALGLGEALPLLDTRIEGLFVADGEHPSAGAPLAAPRWGSWAGSDANTGAVTLTFDAPPGAQAILVPIAAGPEPSGTSLELRSADGRTLWRLDPAAGPFRTWAILRVPLTERGRLSLLARDDGTAWGSWIAVGAPRACPGACPPSPDQRRLGE